MRRWIAAWLALLMLAMTAPAMAEEWAWAEAPTPAEDAAPEADASKAAGDAPVQGSAIAAAEDFPEAPLPQPMEDTALTPNGGTVPSVVAELAAEMLPLKGVKIGIDPGHQARGNSEKEAVAPGSSEKKAKVSSGTSGVSTGIPEYITVLEISLKLRDALKALGAEVYMTRESHDVDISNQERAQMMNDLGVDLVLRIHCDGAENRSKNGIALYCSRSNSIAAESYRAAEAILPVVAEATGAKANGIVQNDNYTGQNWSTVPCIMVECGFMSNAEEDMKLNDPDYQWKLATGLANGIVAYIQGRDAQ